MDSPPECVPPVAREPRLSSPSMPSLDHSPQALQSTSSEPSPPGSPSCPLSGAEEPPSPTPAVALLPGQLERGGPSGPSPGLGALERAISSEAQSSCSEELDLQLFNSDAPARSGLRFPCTVCGKRFRFQSILSLHARAHSLERRPPHGARHRSLDRVIRSLSEHELGPSSHGLRKSAEQVEDLHSPRFVSTPPLLEASSSSPATPAFRCHACKGKFRTASELARHVRILHNPYKCTMCPFSASQEESLAAHLQESHPPHDSAPAALFPPHPAAPPLETPPTVPAFRCETCGQRFTQSWFLKGHMRKHKDSLDHKCQVCGRGFKEPWFLKNHMKVHLNKLGLKAADPGKSPASSQVLGALYSNLLLARGVAGGAGSGGHADASKSSILSYLGLPKDASNGSCVERLQAVAQVAEMGGGRGGEGADLWQLVARGLVAAQHQQPRPLPQQQVPPSRGGADAKRVRSCVETEASGWECPDCGKTFRSLQQVVAHARVHVHKTQKSPTELLNGGGAGEHRAGPDHQAKQISAGGRASGSLHSVISHLSGQNGLRAQSASSSPRERVRGTGMKDCPYCGKAFRSSHHLKVHLRVHTGERPYKCPHCDYAGTQSGSLKYHLQRHHREQRNAMTSSPSSPSPGLLPPSGSSRDGVKKQRRLPSLSQSLVRASGEPPHHQPWTAGPSDKSGSSGSQRQREADLGSLSGMMGTLFPAGQDAGWIGEAPFPKVPKASRRKPLTTSRMVSANGCQDGTSSSGEPLDLSRRPSLEESFAESGQSRDVLNQCVFCPFRTSSVELMAMHIQVNHTSKSRRKRGGSSKRSASHPMSLWKFLGLEEGRASPDYWASSGSNVENGVSPEAERDLSPPPLGGLAAPEKAEDLDEDEEQADDLDAMDDDQSVSPDEPLQEEQAIFGN